MCHLCLSKIFTFKETDTTGKPNHMIEVNSYTSLKIDFTSDHFTLFI